MLDSTLGNFVEALSYDDVLLTPQYSEVLPGEVDLTTRLSRHFTLKAPILSAAMDTVTEARTAISMAQLGGIGIIHKNMSIDDQALEVSRVKRSESGMITNPVTVNPQTTVGEVISIMDEQRISGLPVVEHGVLVGIVTGRDIRFETDNAKLIRDVMTSQVITAPKGTQHEEAVRLLHKHRIEKLPVVDGKTLIGLYTIRDIENTKRYPHAAKDQAGRLLVGGAVGTGDDGSQRAEALLASGADIIIVDTAHGHSKSVLATIKKINSFKSKYDFDVIAGNIATADATLALIQAGADAIKVGIGPGSICTTRIIAGIGVPQFSAVMACAKAAASHGVPVIADGGIKFSGDIVKALAAGAQTVMVGSLLAGTEEAPGEMVIYQGKSYKAYRGMGSLGAMTLGSKDRYFQGDVEEAGKLVPEGIEGRVAYKGPLSQNVFQLLGGVRSGMGYLGARTIEELRDRAQFVRISPAGLKESHVHDVYITRESPNYKLT